MCFNSECTTLDKLETSNGWAPIEHYINYKTNAKNKWKSLRNPLRNLLAACSGKSDSSHKATSLFHSCDSELVDPNSDPSDNMLFVPCKFALCAIVANSET